MGQLCVDAADCQFQNRDKARTCPGSGIPRRGTLVQGRYEIQELAVKDRATVTLHAVDQLEGHAVTVRVLLPRQSSETERKSFLQDGEFAKALSSNMQEPGSIYVTDYGQDGPVAFLVKSEFSPDGPQLDEHPLKPQMIARVEGNVFPINPPTPSVPVEKQPDTSLEDDDEMPTQWRLPAAKGNPAVVRPGITTPGSPPFSHNRLAQANRA